MDRSYYNELVSTFNIQSAQQILGSLTSSISYDLEENQRNAWLEQIKILKKEIGRYSEASILFEYTIPRVGKRIDNILIYGGLIFLIEFKIGSEVYSKDSIDQAMDYALDLKYFHKESHDKTIIPILIASHAPSINNIFRLSDDNIANVFCCNENNLGVNIDTICHGNPTRYFDVDSWVNSIYMPTPTIIEAAQALYQGHDVKEISRSDSGAINLADTTQAINTIIDNAKQYRTKSICFVTGVPGSGKTLAGLNIANERHRYDEDEHAVLISGNQPLVSVLQESLARDENQRSQTNKKQAKRNAKTLIDIIHLYRDNALMQKSAPFEKVVIFDEAQRAWDSRSLHKFMKEKKNDSTIYGSEPEFLIDVMDRHQDWAVIICLVGGGQEINTGEAGLEEWFFTLKRKFSNWEIYISSNLNDSEYIGDGTFDELVDGLNYHLVDELHLAISLRSYRSEQVSELVKLILDVNTDKARRIYSKVVQTYPIVLTRNLDSAKEWVKNHARGTERYGLTASSGAKRLRKYGIWVQKKIEATNWFLNGKNDVRSSYFLEETATEFDIQGLELDWTVVCWDANLRFERGEFQFYSFKGTKWQHINKPIDQRYLKNAYRVLLTRARQGFVIFIPDGDIEDYTRSCSYYDGIYGYLKSIGIQEI